MRLLKTSKSFFGVLVLCLVCAGAAACTNAPVANTNTTVPNVNASPATNANANTTPADAGGVSISAREPERYSATYVVSGQTAGAQSAAASTSVEVARNGSDRRYAIDTKVPGVGQIIYLDRADKSYLIMPARKQYFELTPETTGFKIPRAMTPGMMIEQLQKQRGVEQVGEEQLGGRTAVKYRFAGAANTNTQAGQVKSESFVWVDKETGLPLKAEGASASTGNVQGVSGATGTMEMRNLKIDPEASLFELPQGYTQLTPEQVQQQIKGALSFLQMFMGNMNSGGGNSSATPSTSASPAAPTGSPAVP